MKVTVPVGVPVPIIGATVAVKVTCCPTFDGFNDETVVVVVSSKLTVCSGESVSAL